LRLTVTLNLDLEPTVARSIPRPDIENVRCDRFSLSFEPAASSSLDEDDADDEDDDEEDEDDDDEEEEDE